MRAANRMPKTTARTEAGEWLREWNRWANVKSAEHAAEMYRITCATWMPKTTTTDPWLLSQGQR